MSYRIVRAYGEVKSEIDLVPILCEESGGRWDSGLDACICPPENRYDPSSSKCVADTVQPNVEPGSGSGSGIIGKGEIPVIPVTREEVKTVAQGAGLWGALIGGLGLIGIGGGIAYIMFGGKRPYYKPEFEWED